MLQTLIPRPRSAPQARPQGEVVTVSPDEFESLLVSRRALVRWHDRRSGGSMLLDRATGERIACASSSAAAC